MNKIIQTIWKFFYILGDLLATISVITVFLVIALMPLIATMVLSFLAFNISIWFGILATTLSVGVTVWIYSELLGNPFKEDIEKELKDD